MILGWISMLHSSGTFFSSIDELIHGIAAQYPNKRLAFDELLLNRLDRLAA